MTQKDDKFPKIDKKLLNEWMETFFKDPFQRLLDHKSFRVDMFEDDATLIVEAELPGLRREQIDVEVLDSALRITANHSQVHEEKNDNQHYYHRERTFGQLERIVTVPFQIDASATSAEYHNGILRIFIPKGKQQDRSRTITIQ
ncbi:MAG TPA: Hsp20/alpha crystallin family protein [Bacillales bacterium]|nr:Hsp20/alpha crystallin family protein [Bacillales bacterium]